MKRSIFLTFFSMFLLLTRSIGQDEPIKVNNPSFEGIAGEGGNAGKLPDGWYDCGFPMESPPDVHPKEGAGAFQVTKEAFHGKTYIGLVVRDNDTWEMVSQRLSSPLQVEKCYEFSISLSRSEVYVSPSRASVSNQLVNYATPVKLRIWGGTGYCSRTELLAESSLIVNTRWLTYNFRFEPKQNITYIVLEAFYKTPTPFPYNGNLLLDNASDILPVPCTIDRPIAENTPKKDPNKPTTPPNKPTKVDTPVVKKTTPALLPELENPSKLTKGQTIRLDKLYFPADSATINIKSIPTLTEVYNFLATNPNVIVEIGGHTNGIPSHEYCDRLSTERAKAIVDYLATKGITRKRLQYKGYGKRNPVDTNNTDVGRKRNQRVEIKILSTTG